MSFDGETIIVVSMALTVATQLMVAVWGLVKGFREWSLPGESIQWLISLSVILFIGGFMLGVGPSDEISLLEAVIAIPASTGTWFGYKLMKERMNHVGD